MANKNKWNKFKAAMKAKRTQKSDRKEPKEEIVVQRLSADVSGKAQKYSRVGLREFVKLEEDGEELTIENIKTACLKHFGPNIGNNTVCDILAGEQGPSCTTMKQIPDTKLIYVRFISDANIKPSRSLYDTERFSKRTRRSDNVHYSEYRPSSLPSPKKSKATTTATVPKSLSVTHMLKLGKVVKNTSTVIDLYKFDITHMNWSAVPKPVEFNVSKELLGEGGFRKAYKATTSNQEFSGSTWVVKEYKDEALKNIEDIDQTVESHTQKVVQMHCLAQNFANQCKTKIQDNGLQEAFGEVLQYGDIYLGKKGEDFVTVEQFVEGKFDKYINNDGTLCKSTNKVLSEKAECLTHFSYEK